MQWTTSSKLIIRLPQNSSVYDKPRIKGQKGISNLQNITKSTNPQPSPTDTLPPTTCSKAERRTARDRRNKNMSSPPQPCSSPPSPEQSTEKMIHTRSVVQSPSECPVHPVHPHPWCSEALLGRDKSHPSNVASPPQTTSHSFPGGKTYEIHLSEPVRSGRRRVPRRGPSRNNIQKKKRC